MKLSSIKLLFFVHQLLLVSIIVGAANVLHVDDGNGSVNLDGFNNGTVGHFDHELLGGGHHLMAEEKNDAAAEDVNGNVHFVKPGKVNLTLKYNDQLSFQVCTNCTGNVHICYESSDPDGNLKGDCRESSQCSLQIEGTSSHLEFGPLAGITKPSPPICDTIKITGDPYLYKDAANIKTCKPKIENGMIRLDIIKADGRSCSVQAINANVKLPEIIATPSQPQTSVKPINSTETSNSGTSESSFPWWIILIICVGLLALGIGIGIVVHFWCKKCRSSKPSPTEITYQPPLVVVTGNDANKEPTVTKTPVAAPAAIASNDNPSSKRKANLNFTKFEPTVQSKKGKNKTKKATTTQEPTTTEDAPAPLPVSKQPVLAQTGDLPTVIGKTPRLVPRAMKSVKTDSLDMTLKKDKMEMIESVIDSVKRNCLPSLDSEMVQEMKDKYPEINHHVRVAEIELLCVPVGKMLEGINSLAHESKQKLTSLGCKFDEKSRFTSVSGYARSLLQKQKTPASTVYFAFGAQYHRLISDKDIGSYSIPLLMVFALQVRFPEQSRRKACAMIRRKIPIVLGSFTEASRRKMPFPLNIIEDAYCRDPIMFRHLSVIQTDSEEYRKQKQMKEGSY